MKQSAARRAELDGLDPIDNFDQSPPPEA